MTIKSAMRLTARLRNGEVGDGASVDERFCGVVAGVVDHSRIAWSPGRAMCTLSSTDFTQLVGM
jgi:hypothetical protein